MDDHCYDVDEIFSMFKGWYGSNSRDQSDVVEDYADNLFDKSVEEQADDHATLVCAMTELYKDLTRLLRNQNVVVLHAAYYEETSNLVIVLDNSR